MLKKIIFSVSFIVFGASVGNVAAGSFDCSNMSSNVIRLSCEATDLDVMNAQLDKAYNAALEKTTDKNSLIKSQQEWLKGKSKCGDTPSCIRQYYLTRIGNLGLLANNPKYKTIDDTIPKDGYAYPEYTRIDNVEKPLRFKLTYGDDYPLCKDFVDMLNAADYQEYPACERKILPQFPGFKAVEWTEMTDKNDMLKVMEYLVSLRYASQGKLNHAFHKRVWKHMQSGINDGSYKLYRSSINMDKDEDLEMAYFIKKIHENAWQYNSCSTIGHFYVDDSEITIVNAKEYQKKGYFFTANNANLFIKDSKVYQSGWTMGDDSHHFIEIWDVNPRMKCGINLQ